MRVWLVLYLAVAVPVALSFFVGYTKEMLEDESLVMVFPAAFFGLALGLIAGALWPIAVVGGLIWLKANR